MLTIQKLVLLLNKTKLDHFSNFLFESGNSLPLKLVEAIHKHGMQQPESEQLCKEIYGDDDEKSKRKFFQLAHYTFRLTSFLARRYPYYLSHNIAQVGELFNKGEHETAELMAENLLDISIKIEDFATQTWVLKFLINLAHIREKRKDAIRLQQLLNNALKNEHTLNEVNLFIRENLNFKDKKNITEHNAKEYLKFFEQYREHESFSVRVLSRYGTCYSLNFLDDKKFYAPGVKGELDYLSSELEKHSYVIFPFSDDVLLNIDYLRLKHALKDLSEEEVVREAIRLTKKWSSFRFWQTHIDTSQIVSMSLQVSYYITNYCWMYQQDFQNRIPASVRENIEETIVICEQLLEQMKEEKDAHLRFINLNNIYCMLLLFRGREGMKQSVRILEGLMINYQQIPFQKLYDSIFVNLIIAYFSMGEHTQVNECYRRYEKLTARKVKIEENDLTIKAFYYLSQWIQTGREQYVEKFQAAIDQSEAKPSLSSTCRLLNEMADYYDLPLKD